MTPYYSWKTITNVLKLLKRIVMIQIMPILSLIEYAKKHDFIKNERIGSWHRTGERSAMI